jgi:hypothetical protein
VSAFEAARLDALEDLTSAQDALIDAPTDRTVEQGRAVRDALSLISAVKAELRKAAPVATGHRAAA